jgi:hypothetical protein
VSIFNRAFAARVDDSEQTFVDRLHITRGGLRRSQGGAADRLTRTVNHYLVKSFDEAWGAAEAGLAGSSHRGPAGSRRGAAGLDVRESRQRR